MSAQINLGLQRVQRLVDKVPPDVMSPDKMPLRLSGTYTVIDEIWVVFCQSWILEELLPPPLNALPLATPMSQKSTGLLSRWFHRFLLSSSRQCVDLKSNLGRVELPTKSLPAKSLPGLLRKAVVICEIKHLQNVFAAFLQMLYFTRNHGLSHATLRKWYSEVCIILCDHLYLQASERGFNIAASAAAETAGVWKAEAAGNWSVGWWRSVAVAVEIRPLCACTAPAEMCGLCVVDGSASWLISNYSLLNWNQQKIVTAVHSVLSPVKLIAE